MPAGSSVRLLALAVQLCAAFAPPRCARAASHSALARWPRARAASMVGPILPAPPAPPPASFDKGYGGGDDSALLLTDVSHEERHALASLWAFQYECDAEFDESDGDVQAARYMARWVGDLAPTGWFGMLKGRALGAYFGTDDSEQPEALIAVRYERDNSDLKRFVFGRHLMIVDEVLLAPSVPDRIRPMLHAGLVQAMVAMGDYHGMTVAFLSDFDI